MMEFDEFVKKLKGKLFEEEIRLNTEINGYDFNNGYSSSCHDTRVLIDKLAKEYKASHIKQEKEKK